MPHNPKYFFKTPCDTKLLYPLLNVTERNLPISVRLFSFLTYLNIVTNSKVSFFLQKTLSFSPCNQQISYRTHPFKCHRITSCSTYFVVPTRANLYFRKMRITTIDKNIQSIVSFPCFDSFLHPDRISRQTLQGISSAAQQQFAKSDRYKLCRVLVS